MNLKRENVLEVLGNITEPDLKKDMSQHPQFYTAWFKILIDQHYETIQQHLKYEISEN
jgi:hypothetical protein